MLRPEPRRRRPEVYVEYEDEIGVYVVDWPPAERMAGNGRS